MRAAILCYEPADESVAREIGDMLERNCPGLSVSYGEAVVRPGFDLIDAMERGLAAEFAIVLLSATSVPRWDRQRWEPIVTGMRRELGSEIVFVLVNDCRFPPLFRHERFFDFSIDPVAAKRALKRWFLDQLLQAPRLPVDAPTPESDSDPGRLSGLVVAVVDQPGTAEHVPAARAAALAHAHAEDFESVFWIDCTGRTRAGVLGDTAQALGARLAGSTEQNRAALERLCSKRRFLFAFVNLNPADRDAVRFGGMSSIVFASSATVPDELTIESANEIFASWRHKRAECLRALAGVQHLLRTHSSHAERLQLTSAVVALLREESRLAEAHEVLGWMAQAAAAAGNTYDEYRLRWEQNWIAQFWDEPESPRPLIPFPNADQLAFDFAP